MVPTVGVSHSNPVCSVFLGCLIRSNISPSAIMLLCNVDDEVFVIIWSASFGIVYVLSGMSET
jgi:hypothetical protein